MTQPARSRVPSGTVLTSIVLATGLATSLASSLAAQGANVDWNPTAREILLNTNFHTFQNTSIGKVSIAGGLFVFRNVTIPKGARIQGTGTNPLIFIVTGTFRLDGELSVRGGDGQRVDTLNSANFPAAGGVGHCGGGNGGRGSPNTTGRSITGEAGWGPLQLPNFGGQGGRLSCTLVRASGSGGGGGAFATQGDPWFKVKAGGNNVFPQQKGQGGFGRSGSRRTLAGGLPGIVYFRDNNPGNNFIGLGVDVNRRILILGELPLLVGGSGGAGGGDFSSNGSCVINDANFVRDDKGGGGGGGGGVVAIVCDGKIILGAGARLSADGGNGGGGAWAGSNSKGAGGGGGAGGLVALWTRKQIDIQVNGETYANNDFNFPVSADGGVGLRSNFGGTQIKSKYDPKPNINVLDASATGGFGGMGLIQFMAPVGQNADGTNTHLDDNIILRRGNVVLTGAQKQRYLAWRGFPDRNAVWRDDFGKTIVIGDKEGDFRPTPILLPVF